MNIISSILSTNSVISIEGLNVLIIAKIYMLPTMKNLTKVAIHMGMMIHFPDGLSVQSSLV